jgi:uncharacterized protein
MQFNVAQLLKESIGASRRHEIVGELCDLDENNPGPLAIQGQVLLLRTAAGILASGRAETKLVQTCRRCLELTEAEVSFTFEEEYLPSIDVITGAHLPLPDDQEAALVIDEHHLLDLTEILRQYVVITGVTFGLCRPDCQGLCPNCGSNLNLGPCSCDHARLDARFAALAELLKAKQQDSAPPEDDIK